MKKLPYASVLFALMTTVGSAQVPPQSPGPAGQIMNSIPGESATVTHWYKQNVYDPNDSKIGEIMDVLIDKTGKVTGLIIGVGGFLGMGEKDVAVPFDAVKVTSEDNNSFAQMRIRQTIVHVQI